METSGHGNKKYDIPDVPDWFKTWIKVNQKDLNHINLIYSAYLMGKKKKRYSAKKNHYVSYNKK